MKNHTDVLIVSQNEVPSFGYLCRSVTNSSDGRRELEVRAAPSRKRSGMEIFMNEFSRRHPAVLFLYYLLVLFLTMFAVHPAALAASFGGAFLFYLAENGVKTAMKDLAYYCGVFLLLAVLNPIFSHNGETVLFFMNDRPVTMEAILYGAAMAAMIVSVIFWCKCYQTVLTTDKVLYLFGKTVPRLSLVLSMSLRFFPLLKEQAGRIGKAQKAMGMYAKDSLTDRLLFHVRLFDSLLTWMLENAVETADSMKARGYGLKGRSHFSLFRFEKRDGTLLGAMGILTLGTGAAAIGGMYRFHYYPGISAMQTGLWAVASDLLLVLLFLLPFLIDVKEKILWKISLR